MPNPKPDSPTAGRMPLGGMRSSLALAVAGFILLILVSSGTRLVGAITAYRVPHYLLDIRQNIDDLMGAGNLILRHRAMAEVKTSVTNPLFDPVLMRDEANALLGRAIRRLPELVADGGAQARQLEEARQAWMAVATGQEASPERRIRLRDAGQRLLRDTEASMRMFFNAGMAQDGRMAPLAELRFASWQLRMLIAEESAAIAAAATGGTLGDPRVAAQLAVAEGRTRVAMERVITAANAVGDRELNRLLAEMQTSYRKYLRQLASPDTGRMTQEEFISTTAPLAQDYVQVKNAIHVLAGRRIESIRQERAWDLLFSGAIVAIELALGFGLIFFLGRRVQTPLTRLQMALAGADGYFVDWYVRNRVVEFSTGFDIMLGFDPGEIPRTVDGLRWLYHPEDAVRLEAAHRAAYRGDTDRVDAELRMRKKGGGWHWIHIRIRVVSRDNEGRASRLIGVVYDANARHQAEDELRRVRREEEAIFYSSPVALLIVEDRIIRRCNRALEVMFGREPGGLAGQPTRVLFDTEDDYIAVGEKVYEALRKQPHYTYEAEYLRPQHGRFWIRAQCTLLDPSAPEMGYVFAMQDITQARRAQADLDMAVQRQRAMFAALPNGVLILRNRKIVDCNPRFAEMYGYIPSELIGQTTRIFATSDEAWEERGRLTYPAMEGGGVYFGREKVRRRDGSLVDVLVQGCWIDASDHDKGAVFIHTPLNILLDYPG